MSNKDYYNSNKSYSTSDYHNGGDSERSNGCFGLFFVCLVFIVILGGFLLLDENSRNEVTKGIKNAFLGKKEEEPKRTSPTPTGQQTKPRTLTPNTPTNIPIQKVKTFNLFGPASRTSKTEEKKKIVHPKLLPNHISEEERQEHLAKQYTTSVNKQNQLAKKITELELEQEKEELSKAGKNANISDFNQKQARINELLDKIKNLSNDYKDKILELNNTAAKDLEKKLKEFKEYETNYKKELLKATNELNEVRKQKVAIPTTKETNVIRPFGSKPLIKKPDYEKEKLNQMRNEVQAMRRDFMNRLPKLQTLSEKELIEEYDISQNIREEKLKNYKADENNIYTEEFNVELSFIMEIALKNDYPELLVKILNQGYSMNNWGFNGFPALFYANECNSPKCLEILLNNPEADLTRELKLIKKEYREGKERKLKIEGWFEGKNLLHSAAQSGNISLAQKVLNAGVSINKRTKDGKTPLYFAVKYQLPEMVAFLIENKVEIDDYLEDLTNNRQILDYLKTDTKSQNKPVSEERLTLEDKEWQEAYEFIKEGKLVKLFDIYKQKDLSKMSFKGEPAPCIAAQYDKIEILKFLLHEYDCKNLVDSRNNRNALHYAAMNSNDKIIDLLLQNGFNPNAQDKNQNTPLHLAIYNYSTKPLKLLVRKGANINTLNKNKETPLLLAVRQSNYNAMEELLKSGADINMEDSEGKTALDYAVENSSEMFIDYLLLFGANPNHLNLKKQNSLHIAVLNDDVIATKLLLAKGANMNQQDSNGNTPLHYLAQFASTNNEMLNLFNKYYDNFDLTIKNTDGKTPSNISDIDCFAKN